MLQKAGNWGCYAKKRIYSNRAVGCNWDNRAINGDPLPTLQKAKNQIQAAVCMHNLPQWALAFTMYCEDNGGSFPESHSASRREDRPGFDKIRDIGAVEQARVGRLINALSQSIKTRRKQ